MDLFKKFKIGLSRSSKNLSIGLNDLIFKKKIDEKILDDLENFLIECDVGVESAKELSKKFSQIKIDPKKSKKDEIFKVFSDYIFEILKPLEKRLEDMNKNKPNVILVAGVNGVGKTTTIGKLGKILTKDNNKILLAAADTFRAAAVNQLEIWAKKINAEIIKSEEGADPASVAYKALEYAKKNNFDHLIIDTAGRLQNKKNLMDEFKKITTVVKKIDDKSPHETFLILDATTGQSAINQVEKFQKIIHLTGLIMTKLDGTAKGGILLAISRKFKLPIIALGMGEKEDDLEIFNAKHFSKAMMIF